MAKTTAPSNHGYPGNMATLRHGTSTLRPWNTNMGFDGFQPKVFSQSWFPKKMRREKKCSPNQNVAKDSFWKGKGLNCMCFFCGFKYLRLKEYSKAPIASLAPNKKIEQSYWKTAGKPIWILTVNQTMYVHNKWPQIDLVSQTNAHTGHVEFPWTISVCTFTYTYTYT